MPVNILPSLTDDLTTPVWLCIQINIRENSLILVYYISLNCKYIINTNHILNKVDHFNMLTQQLLCSEQQFDYCA